MTIPTARVGQRRVRNGLNDRKQIVDKGALREMDAQQLRNLVQHNDDRDPRFEADQHRFRNEVGDEAQPQERSQQENGTHQESQRCRSSHKDAGSPSGANWLSWAAARMANVVVVLTLSGRDVPTTA